MAQLERISRGEVLGLALALDRALAARCAAMAERFGRRDEAEALTAAMAPDERSRARDLGIAPAAMDEARRAGVFKDLGWHIPEEPTPLSLYRALAWATECAEARFKLFGALGGRLGDEQARALAEDLAQAALSEAARLRKARRRAYRAERETGRPDLSARARGIHNAEALRVAARDIEGRVARQLAALAGADARAARALSITKDVLEALGGAPDDMAAPEAGPRIAQAVNALDHAFAFYDLVQARATDEEVMAQAQRLARRTVERLESLRL